MSIANFDWLCYHRFLVAIGLSGSLHSLRLLIALNFLAVLFLLLWSEGGGDFAVEGGKVGFELLQFFLFACLLYTSDAADE